VESASSPAYYFAPAVSHDTAAGTNALNFSVAALITALSSSSTWPTVTVEASAIARLCCSIGSRTAGSVFTP
jgi:hypothetical protein